MVRHFTWQRFETMSQTLESIGYVVAVFGPLVGIGMAIFGGAIVKMMGIGVIAASALVALYHISFSLLMNAIRDIREHVVEPQTSSSSESSV